MLQHISSAVKFFLTRAGKCGFEKIFKIWKKTVAFENDYYYNILEDRKDNTDNYKKIVSLLNEHLQYDDEGNKRVYVPAVIVVSEGEIIGFDDETSYDTKGFEDPADYWTDEEVSDLKMKLTDMISQVVDNKCTDCNE